MATEKEEFGLETVRVVFSKGEELVVAEGSFHEIQHENYLVLENAKVNGEIFRLFFINHQFVNYFAARE
ncbi:MAG: hypothetical protein ACFFDT_04100 [Candidatus Hodarchaeota archaeon]